jgi:ATP-dependent DNA helicase DinG
MVKFCPNCGSYLPRGKKNCPRCRVDISRISPGKPLPELTVDDVLDNFPTPSLRRFQKEIVTDAVEAFQAGKKCIILAAPTGFGKSYVNATFASVARSFYATPQLALIDQIMSDAKLQSRFVEIKGRQNYRCYHQSHRSVYVGKCVTEDYACPERFQLCPYWIQKVKALNAQSVLLSFAYLAGESQTEGLTDTYLGTRNLLILDEAHNIEEQCLNQISLRISPYTIPVDVYNRILPQMRQIKTETQLKEFLRGLEQQLRKILERSKNIFETTGLSVGEATDRENIERYLANYKLYESSKSEWIWQLQNDHLILQPVFAREFMKELVWKRGKYYIVSSATILDPKQYAELTGLTDLLQQDEICFLQAPSIFPVENRPIIDTTVGPLSREGWEDNKLNALRVIEEILRKEKGNVAIHCHSYHHQLWLVQNVSEDLKPRLIVHTSRNREEKLEEWKHSRGKVFVSVAFSEGQDWKYDVCTAQILLKVPYPDLSDKRVKRRLELGYRQWYNNQAMLEVIQAYGRAIRAEDDEARFYLVDGSFTRLVKNCWRFIPVWFREALPTFREALALSRNL